LRLTKVLFGYLLPCVASLFASSPVLAQPVGIVGIIEGNARLIRQTTRYTLA